MDSFLFYIITLNPWIQRTVTVEILGCHNPHLGPAGAFSWSAEPSSPSCAVQPRPPSRAPRIDIVESCFYGTTMFPLGTQPMLQSCEKMPGLAPWFSFLFLTWNPLIKATCDEANLLRDGSNHCKFRQRDVYDVAVPLCQNRWLLHASQSGGGPVRRPLWTYSGFWLPPRATPAALHSLWSNSLPVFVDRTSLQSSTLLRPLRISMRRHLYFSFNSSPRPARSGRTPLLQMQLDWNWIHLNPHSNAPFDHSRSCAN